MSGLCSDVHECGIGEAAPLLPVQQEEAARGGGDGGVQDPGGVSEDASTPCDGSCQGALSTRDSQRLNRFS